MGRKKTKDKLVEKGESCTKMLTRRSKYEQQMESQNAVFGNPLLMDKIVKYTIHKSNGKEFNKPAIVAIRLVNKSWLQSASRIIKQTFDWTIGFTVVCENGQVHLNDQIHNKIGKKLDQFVSVFSKSSRSTDSFLTVCLDIEQLNLIKKNRKTLRIFFEQCSDMIYAMNVHYPLDGGSLNLNRISLDFPTLRVLDFRFETWRNPNTFGSKIPISQSKANGLKFLKNIVSNSKYLQQLNLIIKDEAAVDTSSIVLQDTIKGLKFSGPITKNELTLFRKNELPRLKAIDLYLCGNHEVPLMYKVLERFQQQLTSLCLNVTSYGEELEDPDILIQFPEMKKLESLALSGYHFQLVPQLSYKLFPNLVCLVFINLPESVFFDFVDGSRFENVLKLKISLRVIDDKYLITLSPNVPIIEKIISSFPNILSLTLKIDFKDTSGLKFLFQNLSTLKKLHLYFVSNFDSLNRSTGYKIMSLFLGISLQQAREILNKTEKNPMVPSDNPGSIMNLQRLNSLTLATPKFDCPGRPKNPLCSDIILKLGLVKMPQLRKIKLLGGFEVEQ